MRRENIEKMHLCFDCKNAYPKKCVKVRDIKKKPANYDFISDCEITYDKDGTISILVKECANFERDSNSPKYTAAEAKRILKVFREHALLELYVASSVEEARELSEKALRKIKY